MALNISDRGDEVSVVDRSVANAMEGRVFDLGGNKVAVLPKAPTGQLLDMAGRPFSGAVDGLDSEGQLVLRVNLDEGVTSNVGGIIDLVRAQLAAFDVVGPDLRVEVHAKLGAALIEISRPQQAAPDLEAAAK